MSIKTLQCPPQTEAISKILINGPVFPDFLGEISRNQWFPLRSVSNPENLYSHEVFT